MPVTDGSAHNAGLPRGIEVLWRDESAAAVVKPSGMLSHNSYFAGRAERALVQAARDTLGRKVWLVQRLDRGTSGVMLVTFAPEDVGQWVDAVSAGQKRYLAVTRGRIREPAVVDRPLRDHKGVEKSARTHVEPLAISDVERVSLVRATLDHGRMHQARRHLARLSHPVVNDANHGDTRFNRAFREQWGVRRLLLHASELDVVHPVTAEALQLRAAFPVRMSELVERLFGAGRP